MEMTSQLRPLDGGGTEASVIAEVNLFGRLVQLGSRMINVVSDQLFDQFVKRVQDGVQAADG